MEKNDKYDSVNRPAHYASGNIECIDAMRSAFGDVVVMDFCLCNAFKYLWRARQKHISPDEDVKKAIWYEQKFLEIGGMTDESKV